MEFLRKSLFKLRESDEVGMYITYISVLIFISFLVHFFFYIFQLKIDIIVQFVRLFQCTHIYKFNLVLSEGYNLGTGDTITDDASFMVNSRLANFLFFISLNFN